MDQSQHSDRSVDAAVQVLRHIVQLPDSAEDHLRRTAQRVDFAVQLHLAARIRDCLDQRTSKILAWVTVRRVVCFPEGSEDLTESRMGCSSSRMRVRIF